jgi:hypothetical protein
VGDALGAPIEFLSLTEIRSTYGEAGLADYASISGRRGSITDDTQMTLFTAEGLIRSWVRGQEKGIVHIPSVIHHAYLRWLPTQGERPRRDLEVATADAERWRAVDEGALMTAALLLAELMRLPYCQIRQRPVFTAFADLMKPTSAAIMPRAWQDVLIR